MIRFLFAGLAALSLCAAPAAAAGVEVGSEAAAVPFEPGRPRDFDTNYSDTVTALQSASAIDAAFSYQKDGDPTVIDAHATASGSAYGDLATGKVGAKATANIDSEASGRAVIGDVLTFKGKTQEPLILTVRHHGLYSTEPTGMAESFLTMGVGGVEGVFQSRFRYVGEQSTTAYQKGLDVGFGGPGVNQSEISAVLIADASSAGVFDRTFQITLDYASFHDLGFFLDLGAYAGQGATADFSQTGSLTVTAPPGVTIYSQSGVFPGSIAAPVPEPASWAMMLLGFAAVGVGLRRRTPLPA